MGLRTARYGVAAARQWAAFPALSLAARQASSLTETSSSDKPEEPHATPSSPGIVNMTAAYFAVAMAGHAAFSLANHSLGYPLDPDGLVIHDARFFAVFMATMSFSPELLQYFYPPPAPFAGPYDMARLERVKPSVVSVSAFRKHMIGDATAAEAKVAWAQVRGSGLIWDRSGHVVTNLQTGKVATGYFDGDDYKLAKGVITGADTEDILRSISSRSHPWSSALWGPAEHAIEHNAAMGVGTKGTLGGPLLNDRGAYIGINTGIRQRHLGDLLLTFLGDLNPLTKARRGYALPIDKAKETVAHMLRPKLGVVTSSEPKGLQLEGLTGCCVAEVNSNVSPLQLSSNLRSTTWSAEGRLCPGDCILSLAGKAVESPSDLRAALDGRSVGDSVTITVRRDKQELTLMATLGEGGAEGKVDMKWD